MVISKTRSNTEDHWDSGDWVEDKPVKRNINSVDIPIRTQGRKNGNVIGHRTEVIDFEWSGQD